MNGLIGHHITICPLLSPSSPDDGKAPTGIFLPVEDDSLGILQRPGQSLPIHPAGDEVGGSEGRFRSLHDAHDDSGAVHGRFQGGHGLQVRQTAEADAVDREKDVAFLEN